MRRGELYRVRHPSGDPKRSRVIVVVGRDAIQRTSFPTVICAPVFTARHGLSSEVDVGSDEGLKHASCVHCDALASVPKSALTDFVGSLGPARLDALARAVRIALSVECDEDDDPTRAGRPPIDPRPTPRKVPTPRRRATPSS